MENKGVKVKLCVRQYWLYTLLVCSVKLKSSLFPWLKERGIFVFSSALGRRVIITDRSKANRKQETGSSHQKTMEGTEWKKS